MFHAVGTGSKEKANYTKQFLKELKIPEGAAESGFEGYQGSYAFGKSV